MRSVQQIDAETADERAALRRARLRRDAAEANRDEREYDDAAREYAAIAQRIDSLCDERNQSLFAAVETQFQNGQFSGRFQVASDVNGSWVIGDTRTRRIVHTGDRCRSHAEARCKQMAQFARERDAAIRVQDKPLWIAPNRAMRPAS